MENVNNDLKTNDDISENMDTEVSRIKNAYHRIFHREMWINHKIPFAKKWLEENDKEWVDLYSDAHSMNDTFKESPNKN